MSKQPSTSTQSTLTSSRVTVGSSKVISPSTQPCPSTQPSPSHTPPGSPPSKAGSKQSYDQKSNPTFDGIREVMRELSAGINSMGDRLVDKIDEACKLPEL